MLRSGRELCEKQMEQFEEQEGDGAVTKLIGKGRHYQSIYIWPAHPIGPVAVPRPTSYCKRGSKLYGTAYVSSPNNRYKHVRKHDSNLRGTVHVSIPTSRY